MAASFNGKLLLLNFSFYNNIIPVFAQLCQYDEKLIFHGKNWEDLHAVVDFRRWFCYNNLWRLPKRIWSGIEVVITGRTRNAFVLTDTWVRIPPTPPEKDSDCDTIRVFFN